MKRTLVVAGICGAALGCGTDAAPSSVIGAAEDASADAIAEVPPDANDDGEVVDAMLDADPFGAYPEGPYGHAVGDVVANLAWEGYENDLADARSTTKPWLSTSMDALRRKAPKGYGLIHVSEFY